MKRLLEYTPRGASLDPIWLRLRTWRVVSSSLPRLLWRHPFGRRPLGRDLRRYITATNARVCPDHAFNEYLEVVYEYGVLGVVAVVGGLGLVLWLHVRGVADPAFLRGLTVWLLTMTGSITLRTWPFPALGALLILGARWAS